MKENVNLLVYDDSADYAEIKECAVNMDSTFKLYSSCDVCPTTLTSWKCQQNPAQECKTVFIVHAETDEFLSTIQGYFKQFFRTSFIVLLDSNHQAGLTACKEIKAALKKRNDVTPDEVNKALERIVAIRNIIDDMDSWIPKVIMFLCPSPTKNTKPRRNVSVFFEIDPNNDTQIKWMDKQRKVLETDMKLTCRYSDGDQLASEQSESSGDERDRTLDMYLKNSECVVMYISGVEDLLGIRSFRGTLSKSVSDVNTRVKRLCEKYIKHQTKFIVFIEKDTKEMNAKLDDNTDLFLVGANGAFTYWMGLLSVLGKVNIPRKPDVMFHSDITHEEVRIVRFNPATLLDGITQRQNTRVSNTFSDENVAISAGGDAYTPVRRLSQVPVGQERHVVGVTYQMKPEVSRKWFGPDVTAGKRLSCFPFLSCYRSEIITN